MRFPKTYDQYLQWRYWMHTTFLAECLIPKIRAGQTIRVGTHNEVFHADEVTAVVMMRMLITKLGGECSVHRIDRKDRETLDGMDVLLDVGRELDPANGRFDHHQPGGTGYRVGQYGKVGIPFSTCGLIWHAIGLVLTGEADGADANSTNTPAFFKVDRELVQGIDASDNGVLMPNGYRVRSAGNQHEVFGSPMHLSKILGMCNSGDIHNAELQFQKFNVAMDIAQTVLENCLSDAKTFAAARPKLETALNGDRQQREVLVLHEHIRWSEHIGQADRSGDVKIVIAPVGGPDNEWNVHIVRRNGGLCIPGAPESWRGLEGHELSAEAGLEGMVFCHGGGHLVRTASKKAALAVANYLLSRR